MYYTQNKRGRYFCGYRVIKVVMGGGLRDYTNDYGDSVQIITRINEIIQSMVKLCGVLINKILLYI